VLSGYADRSNFTGIWNTDISVFCSALPNLRDPEIPKLTAMGRASAKPDIFRHSSWHPKVNSQTQP
ncbi:hypothetical protein J4G07_12265, partial [Candidatus Poribacteria bacterium]|nr:hypothetical protein [Candidatus Poribacteria bacterium]